MPVFIMPHLILSSWESDSAEGKPHVELFRSNYFIEAIELFH